MSVTARYEILIPDVPRNSTPDDLLAQYLQAVHLQALVEKAQHHVHPASGVVLLKIWLTLAGAGEAEDHVRRFKALTGVPSADVILRRPSR